MRVVVPNLSVLSDATLWCRTERHQWDWVTDKTVVSPSGRLMEVERHSKCLRCKATRVRVISASTWHLVRAKITYPEGYLIKGSGRIDPGEVFREQFERQAS